MFGKEGLLGIHFFLGATGSDMAWVVSFFFFSSSSFFFFFFFLEYQRSGKEKEKLLVVRSCPFFLEKEKGLAEKKKHVRCCFQVFRFRQHSCCEALQRALPQRFKSSVRIKEEQGCVMYRKKERIKKGIIFSYHKNVWPGL